MDIPHAFLSLATSLGLGLLVGMQRERTKSRLGGIRTFALITVFGTLCAILAESAGEWIIAAGLIGVVVATTMGNVFAMRQAEGSPGITSEIAILAMFAVGAMLHTGPRAVGVVAGAGVAILLHAKPILHGLVAKLGDTDVRAIMQFALVTLVILPIVPDETFGPYDVLNPHHIWLMVCLVVGISLVGYLLYRVFGAGVGIPLAGLLGGLISSTATTASYARRAHAPTRDSARGRAGPTVAVIMIATTVVYARVLIEIGATSPRLLPVAAGPVGALAGVSVVLSFVAWFRTRRDADGLGEQKNPSELKAALVFGAIYALVLLAVAAAKANLGDAGLYAVAAISGLSDMDSITLSMSRMVHQNELDPTTAWRCVLVGAMSNMAAKLAIVGALGGVQVLKPLAMLFAVKFAVGLALLFLWP